MNESKKVIYYYYDGEGNRRLLSLSHLDDSIFIDCDSRINFFKKYNQDLNNLYIQIDGVEFKLL